MLKTIVNKYWPVAVAFLAFLSFNIPEIIALFDSTTENSFDWRSLLLFLAAVITMFRVWSKDQAQKLASSEPTQLIIEKVNANKSV